MRPRNILSIFSDETRLLNPCREHRTRWAHAGRRTCKSTIMNEQQDVVEALVQTARSLKQQAEILRKQSSDLMKEAGRIRSASKKMRAAGLKKRKRRDN